MPENPSPNPRANPSPPAFDGPTLDMASGVSPTPDAGSAAQANMTVANATIDWSGSTHAHNLSSQTHASEMQAPLPARDPAPPSSPALPKAPGSIAPAINTTTQSPAGSPAVSVHGLPIIDGYDLLRAAGKGGMGVVYEAVQLATGRRVAIKLLPESALASELARTRFAREVEVVARLQHPGIVPILDSGVRRGVYFYAMDFVEGEALDVVLPPGKGEDQRVVKMMCEICDSVDYAHQRGVLHRDLKPSNVLVDRQGKPHLLDFGLAKQTGDSSSSPLQTGVTISGAGQLLGTVAFMSPEQAAGNADQASVRSDVYSLGVMTYLLLTGKLPISMSGSLREVLTWIAEREPIAPSRVKQSLGKDIDAILLKSLEKAPERRYATAGELAADLRRWLLDEPILARPITSRERSLRWIRKNKALSTTIAAAGLTLVVVSTTLVTRIIEERNRANAAALFADQKRAEAEQNFERSEVNRIEAENNLAEAKLNLAQVRNLFDPPDLDSPDITVLELLDKAMERLARSSPDNPKTEAGVREVMASVYRKLGRYANAKANGQRVVELRRLAASSDAREDLIALAESIHNLAAILWWQRDYEHALPLYQESLRIRRGLFPGDHRDVATSLTHLGACLLNMGDMDESVALYNEALAMRRRLFGEESEPVAQALNNLSKWHSEKEDFDQSEALSRKSLAIVIKVRGDRHPGTSSVAHNLALSLLDQGKFVEARAYFQRAVDIRQELYPSGHHLTASSLTGLARALLATGEAEEARKLASEADTIYVKIGHEQRVDIAETKGVIGQALGALGRTDEGLETLLAAKTVLDSSLNPPAAQSALLHTAIGEAQAKAGKASDAQASFEQALRLATRARGSDSTLAREVAARRTAALAHKE